MTAEVVKLFPCQHIPDMLRQIADDIEAGHYENKENTCTVVLGYEVFHAGSINADQAAKDAIFNMTMGIGKLNYYVAKNLIPDE